MAEFVWRKQDVDARREFLAKRIESIHNKTPDISKTRILLSLVLDDPEADAQYQDLDRFILIVRCLVEHRKTGELRDNEITKMVDLARTILMHSGVKPRSSKLSYLYENLYLVLSQTDWDRHRAWDAAWNQLMSKFFSEYGTEEFSGKQLLASATRSFRLGFGKSAIDRLDEVLASKEATSVETAHAAALKCRMLRLMGRHEEFLSASIDLAPKYSGEESYAIDLAWEHEVFRATESGDILPLVKAVAKGEKFYFASYILEAHLLARIQGEKRPLGKLEKLSTVENRRDFTLRDDAVLYNAVVVIEECYDSEIPLQNRLIKLGSVLSDVPSVNSIYGELLVLAAASRWLQRARLTEFSNLCADSYRAICLRLTSGASDDTLSLLASDSKEAA